MFLVFVSLVDATASNFSELFFNNIQREKLNPFSVNPTKWPNTLKQFVGKLQTNCLCVFGHFVNLALKRLSFTEFSSKIHWNTRFAASHIFHRFTQSIKFFWLHCRTDVWKMWFTFKIKKTIKMNGYFFQ